MLDVTITRFSVCNGVRYCKRTLLVNMGILVDVVVVGSLGKNTATENVTTKKTTEETLGGTVIAADASDALIDLLVFMVAVVFVVAVVFNVMVSAVIIVMTFVSTRKGRNSKSRENDSDKDGCELHCSNSSLYKLYYLKDEIVNNIKRKRWHYFVAFIYCFRIITLSLSYSIYV